MSKFDSFVDKNGAEVRVGDDVSYPLFEGTTFEEVETGKVALIDTATPSVVVKVMTFEIKERGIRGGYLRNVMDLSIIEKKEIHASQTA